MGMRQVGTGWAEGDPAGADLRVRGEPAQPPHRGDTHRAGRLPRTSAVPATSSPATTRSRTASAWSGGSSPISRSAHSVPACSMTSAAASGAGRPASTWSRLSSRRRHIRRPSSMARCRAMRNSHTRNAVASPPKRGRSRTTWSHVSDATSSAASPHRRAGTVGSPAAGPATARRTRSRHRWPRPATARRGRRHAPASPTRCNAWHNRGPPLQGRSLSAHHRRGPPLTHRQQERT